MRVKTNGNSPFTGSVLLHMTQTASWIAWNIFLAFVPVLLAQVISGLMPMARRSPLVKLGAGLLAVVWLVFLPNTCYLLTEWRHFFDSLDSTNLYLRAHTNSGVTLRLMTYTAFYFCYSGIGIVALTLAIRPVARIVKKEEGSLLLPGIVLFGLVAIGVYLGLVLRFNSWDLVTRPSQIWRSIVELAYRPRLAQFLVVFGGFLWLAYEAMDIWIDGLILRLHGTRPGRPASAGDYGSAT